MCISKLFYRYHNRVTVATRTPTTGWKKADIEKFLTDHGVEVDPEKRFVKAELLQMAKDLNIEKKYMTDEMAENSGKDIKVLRLQAQYCTGHCELNPIEMIWAQIKKKIADENKTFKIKDVKELADRIIGEVSADQWERTVRHVIEVVELRHWENDSLMDDIELDPVEEEDLPEVDEEGMDAFFADMGLDKD